MASLPILVMLRRTVLLAALQQAGRTGACPYAAEGGGILPAGHPIVGGRRARLQASGMAPDAMVPDEAGGRFHIPGGGITNPSASGGKTWVEVFDHLAQMSVASGSGPLCYWSWQSLPPPPHDQKGGTWAAKGFDFTQEEKRGDVAAIRDLCTLAVSRLQAHVDPVGKTGVVMFAGVTEGTDFATYLCEKGLHKDKAAVPERCAAGSPLYNQSYGLRWPMSVTMWRFDGTNAANVTATMKDWRNSWAQHAPNMASPAPSPTHEPVKFPGGTYPAAGTGWGQGGGVFGKLLPCDNIPARFKHQRPFPQDSSPEAGWGSRPVTYLDEALDYWRSTAGLPLSKCMASLAKLCGAAQKRGNLQCDLCAAEHAGVMRTAGCSGAEIQNYCSMAV